MVYEVIKSVRAGEMGLCMIRYEGRDGEVYEAMCRHRERWGGLRGHGQGQGVVGRPTGLRAGTGSGGEAYGAMGRHRERWGGLRGYVLGEGVMGRHTELWAGTWIRGEAYGVMSGHR